MGDFLDPSLLPTELPIMQNFVKKPEDEIDQKKFESEMEKQRVKKTDEEQKKQKKREQEDNEGTKQIVEQAQELIEIQEDSLYSVQKPTIKSVLAKKKAAEEAEKPFLQPSLQQASILFEQNDFEINLAKPPADWIEKQKKEPIIPSVSLSFVEAPFETQEDLSTSSALSSESFTSSIVQETPKLEEKTVIFQIDKEPLPSITKEKKPFSLDQKQAEKTVLTPLPQAPSFFFPIPIEPSSSRNLHQLSPEVFALFERMVGVITLMQNKIGKSETVINLNQPQFASSIFFGCQITIEEYDTAPQEFNIRFSGPELSVGVFVQEKKNLENALAEGFKKGKFHFKVHKIETDLST